MLADWIVHLAEAAPAAEDAAEEPLFNWVIFAAQIVNFLILVVLLRAFLYKRIIQAMDRREKKIASHFEAAEEKEQEAGERARALDEEKGELEAKRESLLAEARQRADERRKELLNEVRAEVDEQARQWREDLAREKESFLSELRGRAARQVSEVARKALRDLADAELERRMAGVLLARLAEMADEERQEFAAAVKEGGKGITVASAWEVPEEDREGIASAVREQFDGEAEVRFETAPELSCGIELRAGGREIAWTVDEYVRDLAENLAAAIDEQTQEEPAEQEQAEPDDEPAEQEQAEPDDESGEANS